MLSDLGWFSFLLYIHFIFSTVPTVRVYDFYDQTHVHTRPDLCGSQRNLPTPRSWRACGHW